MDRYTAVDIDGRIDVTANVDEDYTVTFKAKHEGGEFVGFTLALLMDANPALMHFNSPDNVIVVCGYICDVLDYDAGILICKVRK